MRANIKPPKIERFCSLDYFMQVLGHMTASGLAQTPETLRRQITARPFGDFGSILMAEKPASADLSAHVARWRATDRARREDLPLRPRTDQTADDRRLRLAIAITAIVFLGWITVGVAIFAFAGTRAPAMVRESTKMEGHN